MKARYTYPLLFLLPGAMVAGVASLVSAGAAAGVLWIFVYGDNPWPDTAGTVLITLAFAVFAATLAALVATTYAFGKQREADGGLAGRHVALAIVLSVLIPALVLLHQWQIGNIQF